jgi:hypothetical protein
MKKLILSISLLGLAACSAKPTFQDVKLGDGNPGFLMQCPPGMGQLTCLPYAEDHCDGEYNLLGANYGNHASLYLLSCKEKSK